MKTRWSKRKSQPSSSCFLCASYQTWLSGEMMRLCTGTAALSVFISLSILTFCLSELRPGFSWAYSVVLEENCQSGLLWKQEFYKGADLLFITFHSLPFLPHSSVFPLALCATLWLPFLLFSLAFHALFTPTAPHHQTNPQHCWLVRRYSKQCDYLQVYEGISTTCQDYWVKPAFGIFNSSLRSQRNNETNKSTEGVRRRGNAQFDWQWLKCFLIQRHFRTFSLKGENSSGTKNSVQTDSLRNVLFFYFKHWREACLWAAFHLCVLQDAVLLLRCIHPTPTTAGERYITLYYNNTGVTALTEYLTNFHDAKNWLRNVISCSISVMDFQSYDLWLWEEIIRGEDKDDECVNTFNSCLW